jgi:hypothetical protein
MAEVLTSWKEIAQYLGKGVRTVQRWERELGLPVRRPKPKQKHIVLAFRGELDEWLRHAAKQALNVGTHSAEFQRMKLLMATLVERMEKLQRNTDELAKTAAKAATPQPKTSGNLKQASPLSMQAARGRPEIRLR